MCELFGSTVRRISAGRGVAQADAFRVSAVSADLWSNRVTRGARREENPCIHADFGAPCEAVLRAETTWGTRGPAFESRRPDRETPQNGGFAFQSRRPLTTDLPFRRRRSRWARSRTRRADPPSRAHPAGGPRNLPRDERGMLRCPNRNQAERQRAVASRTPSYDRRPRAGLLTGRFQRSAEPAEPLSHGHRLTTL